MLLDFTSNLSLLLLVNCVNPSPITLTTQGLIRGAYRQTISGRTFSSFTSIPYAEPPVGNLRFEPPKPGKCWEGVYDGTNISHPICPQRIVGFTQSEEIFGQEDCLYLNVYTPKLKFGSTGKLFPLIVFIPGGAFISGEADYTIYNTNIIMNYDVVVIIMNYRLGPLGFLSTGDKVVPGNNGLKDQALAIRWAKDNAKYFGGDPSKLMLMGQSAGAASAHFHMLSPLSKHLMRSVASLSGTALDRWALSTRNETRDYSIRLAQTFNCSIRTSQEMVNCLRGMDADAITNVQYSFFVWNIDPTIPFQPTLEPEHEGAFLTEKPKDIIKSGNAAKVPFLTGTVTQEGAVKSASVFGIPGLIQSLNVGYSTIAPITFLYNNTAPNKTLMNQEISHFYFNDAPIDYSVASRTGLTDAYTDSWFSAQANEAVLLHLKYTTQPVYYYRFGYRTSVSFSELFGDPFYNYGVCHLDDLLYVFNGTVYFPNYIPNSTDLNMQHILNAVLVDYAETGNPTPKLNSFITSKWNPVQTEDLEYYAINSDTDISMQIKPVWNRTLFWRYAPIGEQ